jgi:hypothetical protein
VRPPAGETSYGAGVAVTYELVTVNRAGRERRHRYAAEDPLSPGSIVHLDGRDWLVGRIDESGDLPRAIASPGRYRLLLHYPDGHVDEGAFRRLTPSSPRFGHTFTTAPEGRPVAWEVVEEGVARDERGEPYLELIAERDYEEAEQLPDHELEHTLARRDEGLEAAVEALSRAEQVGLAIELVVLEPGEEPDWDEARAFVDALVLEEIADDLLEQCGVDPDADPRETWIGTVKERLREDLAQFRADVEGDHAQVEEWEFREGRIFASVGTPDDESDPNSGHGWLCRLLDSGTLAAAGFSRVQKARLRGDE